MGEGIGGAPIVLPACAAGFFCLSNSSSTHPYTKDAGNRFGPCPVGHHCPLGNSVPIACLEGTYSNQERAISAAYCLPCPPGFLCTIKAQNAPEKFCPFGKQCKTTGKTGTDTACTTTGKYCALGSHEQLVCPAGFYNTTPSSPKCFACPAGQFCMGG